MEAASGIAMCTGTGVLGIADGKAAALAVWKHTAWAGLAMVWDFRDAQLDTSGADAFELAQFVNTRQPSPAPVRVAIVASRDVDYGMARIFGAYRQRTATDVQGFRDFDVAVEWARAAERTEP
jgi:hypothetical protein